MHAEDLDKLWNLQVVFPLQFIKPITALVMHCCLDVVAALLNNMS